MYTIVSFIISMLFGAIGALIVIFFTNPKKMSLCEEINFYLNKLKYSFIKMQIKSDKVLK